MNSTTKHNLKWLPFVILVRVPILSVFFVISKLNDFGEWLSSRLPGLERSYNGR